VVGTGRRGPWERPGGTTFHFINDGIEPALDQAREAAGDRDVGIAGGGATILEYVNAGLIDEFSIALSPGDDCVLGCDESSPARVHLVVPAPPARRDRRLCLRSAVCQRHRR
jgi:dihydrofolate reductase